MLRSSRVSQLQKGQNLALDGSTLDTLQIHRVCDLLSSFRLFHKIRHWTSRKINFSRTWHILVANTALPPSIRSRRMMNALIIQCFVPSEEASDPAAPQRRAKERRYSTMPKSSITAVALVAFLAGALSPSADAFVPRQMSAARSATCESASNSNSCVFEQLSWNALRN